MSEQMSVEQIDETDDLDEQMVERIQVRLAVSLVTNLGFEGAVHTCQVNGWDRVLQHVVALDHPEMSVS
jgi:hypothetical protein